MPILAVDLSMKNIFILSVFFSTCCYSLDFELKSSEKQTQIIELYTSEGCSSCPPADRWLSSLKSDGGLWKDFIPMALHVDYWDYIGWKDPFADARNSKRQRQHYKKGNIPSVYTPGVLKAGKEWRAWRFNTEILPSKNKVGVLIAKLKNNKLQVSFNNQTTTPFFKLTIALLAMDVSSQVKAGENADKRLTHEFVVIKQQQFHSNKSQWNVELANDFFQSQFSQTAIVIWVEDLLNPAPIQAVGKIID